MAFKVDTRTNYIGFKKELNSSPTVIVGNSSATLITYTEDGSEAGYPPRAIRCDADGTLEITDFAGNTTAMTVKQGEIIYCVPKLITANTTIATQSMW